MTKAAWNDTEQWWEIQSGMACWEPDDKDYGPMLPRWCWLLIVVGMVGALTALTVGAIACFL